VLVDVASKFHSCTSYAFHLPKRLQYILGATVHRCLQCKTPQYAWWIGDCYIIIFEIASWQHLRSASSHHLFIPCHRHSIFGRRTFSVYSWSNGLELATKESSWTNTFLWRSLAWFNKKCSYRRGTARRAVLVNSGYASRSMGVIKSFKQQKWPSRSLSLISQNLKGSRDSEHISFGSNSPLYQSVPEIWSAYSFTNYKDMIGAKFNKSGLRAGLWRTDRWTNHVQIHDDSIHRGSIASRGKKVRKREIWSDIKRVYVSAR